MPRSMAARRSWHCWTLGRIRRNGPRDSSQVSTSTNLAQCEHPLTYLSFASVEPHQCVCRGMPRTRRRAGSQARNWLTSVGTTRMDDPLVWGLLPMRFWNKRWSFGSHDICFQTRCVLDQAIMVTVVRANGKRHADRSPSSSPWARSSQLIVSPIRPLVV